MYVRHLTDETIQLINCTCLWLNWAKWFYEYPIITLSLEPLCVRSRRFSLTDSLFFSQPWQCTHSQLTLRRPFLSSLTGAHSLHAIYSLLMLCYVCSVHSKCCSADSRELYRVKWSCSSIRPRTLPIFRSEMVALEVENMTDETAAEETMN